MCTTYNYIEKSGVYEKTPLWFKGTAGDYYEIKQSMHCGFCEQCRLMKATAWAVRNYYERLDTKDTEAWAIILNYTKIPKSLIEYTDVQKFFKKLRKKSKEKFKYFISNEYGEKKGLPHYHIMAYGMTYGLQQNELRLIDKSPKTKKPIYTSDKINKIWKFGVSRIQTLDKNVAATYYQTIYQRKPAEYAKAIKKVCEEKGYLITSKKEKKMYNGNPKVITLTEAKKMFSKQLERSIASKGLGFDAFLKHGLDKWIKANKKIYINGKEIMIPYPWLKKLAEYGIKQAMDEIKRISDESIKITNKKDMEYKKAIYTEKRTQKKKIDRKELTIF